MMIEPIWWEYAIFYPEEDEPGYDGVHDGGIKGISDDAPDEAKKAFDEYMQTINKGEKM